MEPIAVETSDGWTLRGDRRGRGRAVAVLGHSMFVDRTTLDRPAGAGLASELARHDLEVLTFDVRGHGESGPRAIEGASWSYEDIVRRDVPAMVARAREVATGRKVVLVGHSLVGHAALISAGLDLAAAPDAIVAIAPNLWMPRHEPGPRRRALKAATLRAWLSVTRARGLFDPRPFRTGTTPEARRYVEELCRMWTRDRLASLDGAVDYEAALARARLPVLALASEGDRLLARPACVSAFLALASSAEVELEVLRGDGAPDHAGIVTRASSLPSWTRIAEWIRARA